jgi:hypothetical protein
VPTDAQRGTTVLAREARRYRALLRDLLLSVEASCEDLHSGDEWKREQALTRIRGVLQRTERVGWPGGMVAKRRGR